MATALNSAQEEIVHFSFPIEKREDTAAINPVDGTPDILITGKATDGTIDGDLEIVDPEWSAKAIQEWCDTGGNVRMSHDPKRPVGKGQHVQVTTDGHYVTSLIADPLCKHFIRTGILNDYSVGISMPGFRQRDSRLDPQGKASRIITGRSDGLSRIAELSVVDRGSNFNSAFHIVRKSAGDGYEFVGEMVGDEDEIAKAAAGALLTKADDDFVNVDLPAAASISISPRDFAALRTFKQQLTVKSAGTTEKRDAAPAPDDDDSNSKGTVTDTAEKADAPAEQEAVVPDVAKDEPARKAGKKPKGKKKLPPWLNKPDDSGSGDDAGSSGGDSSCKGAHAWVHVGGDSPVPDIRCEKCKTTPAEAAGLSGTHDMNPAPVPELMESPPVASTKGSPAPESASGAGEAASMNPVPAHREPDGAIVEPFERDAKLPATGQGETPTRMEAGMMKSSPEVAAILRFKRAGIDTELGRLHDLTCPAYHPEDTAKCHPFADLRHVDEGYFQRKAVEAACGPDLGAAKSVQKAWQAARVLRETDPGVLNDFRLDAHKAFRDANPGPSSALTPGMMAPGKFSRPLVTDGHSATSSGHDGPNSSPPVATTAPDAHSFDRPPLASGHQSPSPSHMKASFEYPDGTGRPQQLNYAQMDKDRGRMALVEMHDHLGRQFPEVCPMDKPGDRPLRGVQPERHPVPSTVGVGKGEDISPVHVAVIKAPAGDDGEFADDEIYKGFRKARKKLGKKVLSGKMTVDEARSRLGRQFSQKAAEPAAPVTYVTPGDPNLTPTQIRELQDSLQKAAGENAGRIIVLPPGSRIAGPDGDISIHAIPATPAPDAIKAAVPVQGEVVTLTASNYGTDPEVIKAAVAEATAELKELLVKQQETFTEKLADQQRVIDAIADQPDPSTAAFSGLAFNPVRKTAGPAGVLSQAEIAERTQQMMIRHMTEKYNASSDPAEREAYYSTLTKMRGAGQ